MIIVDDHSLDGSAEVAHRLAAEDARVTVIVHETNRGHIATYNDGLAAVDTEFVTLVSADDLLAAGALDRAAAVMERHPRVGLVYGKVVRFADAVPAARSYGAGVWRIIPGRAWVDEVVSQGFNPIMSPEAVLRTTALKEVGGYNPRLPHSGDLEYWLRLAVGWDVCQIRGAVQAYYRVHGGNMHLTRFDGGIDNIQQKLAAFDVLRSETLSAAGHWGTEVHARGVRSLVEESLGSARARIERGEVGDALPFLGFAQRHAAQPAHQRMASVLRSEIEDRGPDGAGRW
nr:glycosyltransferase [Microbacterium flavescens]